LKGNKTCTVTASCSLKKGERENGRHNEDTLKKRKERKKREKKGNGTKAAGKKKGPGQMSRDMLRTSNLTCISKRKNIERANSD
jgi:hypothetical protein